MCGYASPVAATDPALWTTSEQAAAIRRGELGSVELLDAHLARIERLDPQVNAVCTLSIDDARAEAVAADEATARAATSCGARCTGCRSL